jgi:hypothetical protein
MRRFNRSAPSAVALATILAFPLALAACGRTAGAGEQTGNQSDSAARAALEDSIMVDPDLTQQSNRNAVTTGSKPASGGVPLSRQSAVAGLAQADALEAVGGKLIGAPAAKTMECDDCDVEQPITLGALAAQQNGKCDARLSYGADWADRMPAAFPVYPRATLREAAGVTSGECDVRVINFRTGARLQSVLDYYYTRARKAGYDGEHTVKGADHYLGGTRARDGAAYVVIVTETGGLRDVDIVASNGR